MKALGQLSSFLRVISFRNSISSGRSSIDIDRFDRSIMIENDNMAENISSGVSNESAWPAEFIFACYFAIRLVLVDRRSILIDRL